ncbi:MAG: hypothetical protein Q8N96_04565 [Methylovulum sp.]|nr:hypothetical protein [Methylovulum sp.]
MRKPKKPKFSDWLQQSFLLLGHTPWMWAGYALFVGVLLVIGRLSPALGIFSAVTCLFVGVGLAKYSDLKTSSEHPVGFYWAVNKSLPLAVIAASGIVIFWFVFMAIANLLAGEFYKIGQFFFYWEFNAEHLSHKSMREIAGWIYSYANIALIFVLLMLNSFVGWFTHPLMLFNNEGFSQAKEQSDSAVSKNQGAIYKLLGFIFIEAILCSTVTPLLTPVLYVLVSILMYVSYKSIFEVK